MPTSFRSITDKIVASLTAGKPDAQKNEFIRDTNTPGFAIAVFKARCSYIVEGRAGRGGRVVRSTLGTVGKLPLEDARKLAKTAIGKLANGVDLVAEHRETVAARERDGMTVAKAFELAMESPSIADTTRNDYARDLATLGKWRDRRIVELTEKEIAARFVELGSGAHAARTMRGLRRAWYCAARVDKTMPRFPSDELKHVKKGWSTTKRRTRTISDMSLPAWRDAVDQLTTTGRGQARDVLNMEIVRDTILFSFYTGCRSAEIRKLTVADVDLQGESFILRDPKANGDITLPLVPQTKAIMERRVANPLDADGHLFVKLDYHRDALQLTQDIARWSPHDFRRGFISASHRAGVPDAFARRLTNHKIAASDAHAGYIVCDTNTLRVYAQQTCDFLDRLSRRNVHTLKLVA